MLFNLDSTKKIVCVILFGWLVGPPPPLYQSLWSQLYKKGGNQSMSTHKTKCDNLHIVLTCPD